jgi:hypothetical protein
MTINEDDILLMPDDDAERPDRLEELKIRVEALSDEEISDLQAHIREVVSIRAKRVREMAKNDATSERYPGLHSKAWQDDLKGMIVTLMDGK